MTLAGWITMALSLTFVWVLTFWCFRRVLKSPQKEKAPPGFGP
jgi:amino acid permease